MGSAKRLRAGLGALALCGLVAGGCGDGDDAEPADPRDWRTVIFDPCCAITLPKDLLEVPQPARTPDPSFLQFARPGLAIAFEYAPQAGFPEAQTTQTGWRSGELRVDGRPARTVSYDAREPAFSGGRTLHLHVVVPEQETFRSAPTPERGMQLSATASCATPADCQLAERIFRLVDFPPFRTASRE